MAAAEEPAGASSMEELSSDNSGLHKEVYGWRMQEDPFGGVLKPERREELKALLFEALSIDLQPSQRSIASLRAFVERAEAVMASENVEWSNSQSAANDDEERRLNSLLSFTNHLSWLIDVFDNQSSVLITVR